MQVLTDVKLNVSSPVFSEGEMIPEKYTCDGENISPPLNWGDLPHNTQSIALIVEDPDAPKGVFVHWLAWNIPPVAGIQERAAPKEQGSNSWNSKEYAGPCPPKGEKHRYYFRVFALDSLMNMDPESKKEGLIDAMRDHVLGEGHLMGYYQRKS